MKLETKIRHIKGKVLGIILMMIVCSLSIVLMPSATASGTTPTWQQGSPMPTNIEQAAVIANATGTIFVIGGFSDSTSPKAINTTWSMNPLTGQWTERAPMPVAVRGAAVALAPDGRIVVFGGANETNGVIKTVQVYQPSDNTWSIAMMSLFDAVWEAKACYLPATGNFYIIGGQGPSTPPSNVVQMMPLTLNMVTKYTGGPGVLPSAREAGSLVLSPNGSRLWYFGGVDSTYTPSNTIYEFDAVSISWTLVNTMPVTLAAQGVVRANDGLYYVYGGGQTHFNVHPGSADGYYFNPYDGTWNDLPKLVQPTKYLGAVVSPDGRIWAIGGGNGTVLNNVQSLQVLSYTVTAPSAVKTGEPFTVRIAIQAPFAQPILNFSGDVRISGADGTTYGDEAIDSITSDPVAFEMKIPQAALSGIYTIKIFNIQVHCPDTVWADLPSRQIQLTVTAQPAPSAQIYALAVQMTSLQEELSQTQTLLDQSWATGNATAAQVAELQSQLTAVHAQLVAAQESLAQAQMAISSGNDTVLASANQTQAQIAAMNAQIEALQTQLSALQTSNNDLKTSVNSKADGTIAMMTMIFALIAVVLIALMLVVMVRKK